MLSVIAYINMFVRPTAAGYLTFMEDMFNISVRKNTDEIFETYLSYHDVLTL